MPKMISLSDVPALLKAGARVYLPGGPLEPGPLLDVLEAAGAANEGVTYFGAWMPGINRRDPALWHAGALAESYFIGADLRAGFKAGRTAFVPMPYRLLWSHFAHGTAADIAFVPVSPMGQGRFSLALNADFGAGAAGNARLRIAVINPLMPCPEDSEVLHEDHFTHALEVPYPPLVAAEEKSSSATAAIARHIAALVRDGDTLEFGIGQLPAAVLSTLKDHRRLKIHSGMIGEGVAALVSGGAIEARAGAITTGFVWGSQRFYAEAARSPLYRFRSVAFTHEFEVLRRIEGFVAVNSVLEVDLFGQANADILGSEQISGVGGLQDFLRGARAAPSGRAIVALASTAQGGTRSRIVASLATPATISRYDTDIIVTEHGVARLAGLGIDARAEALIAIADPSFRAGLANEWARLRRAL